MVSYFQILLSNRNVNKHTKRALWQYQLSEHEFLVLKKMLTEARSIANVDPRDCTLYYAEWWKRYYSGGYPSKRQVFASITNMQLFGEEEFYDSAKKGATMLGVRWLRNQNTLYFKTLLLQGGIPINHIINNKGAYKKFLLDILALNPVSIGDFAFNSSITSILPNTSRNDEIYECCLNIVKAIISEDEEYLKLLQGNDALEEISKELYVKKAAIRLERKRATIRIVWLLDITKKQITLYLAIPDSLDIETFSNFFISDESEPLTRNEYKLFYNDTIICKFIRQGNGQMKTLWINRADTMWTPEANHCDIRLIDSHGRQYSARHIISNYPDMSKATLWTKYSEAQWLLEKGNHTEKEDAYVLFPHTWKAAGMENFEQFSISGCKMQLMGLKVQLTVNDGETQYQFKTHAGKIDWYVVDDTPVWMTRSNLPVVRNRPRIFVYDKRGELIQDPVLKWRRNRNDPWTEWKVSGLPKGYIELQITAREVTEYDSFFNIGNLTIERSSSSFSEAKIKLSNNDFTVTLTENRLLQIETIDQNTFSVHLTEIDHALPELRINLKNAYHAKSLTFEMLVPFRGVEIVDNQRSTVPEDSGISLDGLQGLRLLSNMDSIVVNMYNKARQGIFVIERLNNTVTPLRAFEDTLKQLFTFSNAMDPNSEVVIEVASERQGRYSKLKEYKVKRYEDSLEWIAGENGEFIIATKNTQNADLFAVPLDGSSDTLCLYGLNNQEGIYSLQSEKNLRTFMIFSSKDSPIRVQPILVSLNEARDRSEDDKRFLQLKEQLINSKFTDDIWKKVLDYYQICLNHDLAFAAFDVLKIAASWSTLAARLFVFLLSYTDDDSFIEEASTRIEYDIGLSFHWIWKEDWAAALEWIGCFENKEQNVLVIAGIRKYFNQLLPTIFFETICNYILQDTKPKVSTGYHVNAKVADLRSSLGEKVLSQLPTKCPEIPDAYKDILPVTEANYNVKILLRSPVAVALAISGQTESLWGIQNENIRRNVKYCQQLDPSWYSESICYCITKI